MDGRAAVMARMVQLYLLVLATVVMTLVAVTCAARADCLPSAQAAAGVAIGANAASIMAYDWHGDPWYDQVVPWCGSHAAREAACNAALLAGVVVGTDAAARHASPQARSRICTFLWAAALGFLAYTRSAWSVQLLHVQLR